MNGMRQVKRRSFGWVLGIAVRASSGWIVAAHGIAFGAVPILADPIWLEGERPTAANVAVAEEGVERPAFLSGERWLKVSIDADAVEQAAPPEGVEFSYDFTATAAGVHEVWARIGYEFARSPFEWRVDDGEWGAVSPEELTTDLMALGFWTEVAWLQLGEVDLAPGAHRIAFRVPPTRDADGVLQRMLFALDAVCISAEPFVPHGKYRPGEDHRTAEDREAAGQVFRLPEGGDAGKRVEVSLGGLWEVCRADEQMPGEVAEPMQGLPASARWVAIPVPSDKNLARPDLLFAHRLWYRTRVEVPASMAGRSFVLAFPYNNLNTTVYVNGVYCGFERNPFVPIRIDVTKGIRAGEENEVLVGIRDAWYGRSADPERPMKLRRTFNYPVAFFSEGFQHLDYPVWNAPQSGILATPRLEAAGKGAYVADVFVKPSVARMQLEAEVTVRSHAGSALEAELRWEAVDEQTGRVAHRFAPRSVALGAGELVRVELAGDWADPVLWWPDAPHLYRLRTTLATGGEVVDVAETPFGFREWRVEGTQFNLNGVVWRMWADLVGVSSSPAAWLDSYRSTNQRTARISTAGQADHDSRWLGMEPQEALAFCDRNGVVVRRNTTLDGQRIGYQFVEDDPVTVAKQGGSELKLALMENWRRQCVAQVLGERNHPSIQIWTIENEFAYINLINLLGNSPNMDRYEEEITRVHDAVMEVDPTRSVMIDGGGATRNNTLGVHGDHYVATLDARYPDLAYEPFPEGGGRGRWTWDMQRPRFIGEEFYANGINPADYAMWGGEVTFQGKAATRDAVALIYRMLTEGYRWGGHMAAWHFWLGADGGPAQWVSNAPRAVFTREWDWTFASGQTAARTFGIFNDSRHAEPLRFTRRLLLDGEEVSASTSTHTVPPGMSEKFEEALAVPEVSVRREGELWLTLEGGAGEVYRDVKAVSVLPPPDLSWLRPGVLAVLDPAGGARAFLDRCSAPYMPVSSVEDLPAGCKVLLVGADAIARGDDTAATWAVLAEAGRAVVVLDQAHPLRYQAVPAEMELAPRSRRNDFGDEVPTAHGKTAFLEDASHPALAGLRDKDFFTWGPGQWVCRNVYAKPTRGAKSLVQTGPRLAHSALAEVPVGDGVMLLCQLAVGDKLGTHAVAGHLLANLLRYAADYRLEYAEVASLIEEPGLASAVEAMGMRHTPVEDVLAAVRGQQRIALVSATPGHVAALAAQQEALSAFWDAGGTLVLCGLTPEGLSAFNRIVGVEHLMRPFGRERVTFPPVKHPLTAGLATGDIVLLSGERIFGWTADEYVVSDMFSHVVDLDDIAPFASSNFGNYRNLVNGFVGADGWPLIIDFAYPTDGSPFAIQLDLPREETVVSYTHDASVNYNPTTRIALSFDGRDRIEFAMEPTGDAQHFVVDPPRAARRVTLELVDWQRDPAKRPLVGIDNIALTVQRSAAWRNTVHPMLNVGGLVHYARGRGGVVLCNLRFLDEEAVPVNRLKKQAILVAVLRNLKAPFAEGRTILPGGRLTYAPLDIHTRATTYKDERGWFGGGEPTFAALPAGDHTWGGVPYRIHEMATSPVPQVLMLGGPNVPGGLPERIAGIPIGGKADALFFLHTARIDRPPTDRERREGTHPELCRYIVHYQDGESITVPIHIGADTDHYLQPDPEALPNAQLAWTATAPGTTNRLAAYARQWNNPRPEVPIASVDLEYGDTPRRGVPALLAVTAAVGS